jgi:hypothetical protein
VNAERQVCQLRLTLVPEAGGNAVCPCHSDAAACKGRALVFPAGVGTRAGGGGGRPTGPGQAPRDGSAAGHGAEAGRAVPDGSSRAHSSAGGESGSGPGAVGSREAYLSLGRNRRARERRDAGAAPGRAAPGQRPLARSRALRAFPAGQGQWGALARGAAAQHDSVGGPGLGRAVADRLGARRALSAAAGPTPQALAAGGGATERTAAPVVPRPRGRGGAESSYAVLARLKPGSDTPAGRLIPRFRLEAALSEPAPTSYVVRTVSTMVPFL